MKPFQETDTRQTVADMTRNGCTAREISTTLEISTQRVYQHLDKLGMKPAARSQTPNVMPRRVR